MRLEYLEYCKVQILGPLSSNFICGTKKATYWKNKNKLVNQFFLLVLNYRSAFLKKNQITKEPIQEIFTTKIKLKWSIYFKSIYLLFKNSFIFIHSIHISLTTHEFQNLKKFTFHFNSVAQSCLTHCDSMNRSKPGLPVHHQLPEFTQTHVH